MPVQNIHNPDALLLYKVGPVFVCSPTLLVEAVLLPPQFSVPPGANAAEPGIFRSINGMVRVVDLRVRFGVEQSDFNEPGQIIIAELAGTRVGFWVDEIQDVVEFAQTGWKGVPVYIPREVFSRTLLRDNCIILYADFEKLDKFKASGYLRKHIAQLKTSEKKQTDTLSQRQHALNKPLENKPEDARAKTPAQHHESPSAALVKHPGRIKEAAGLPVDSGKRALVKANKLSTHKTTQAVDKSRDKKAVSESSVIRPAGANKSKANGGVVNRKASGQKTGRLNAGYEQGAREGPGKHKFNKSTVQDVGKAGENSAAKNNISSLQSTGRFAFIWAVLSLLALVLPVYLWVRLSDVSELGVPESNVSESDVQEQEEYTVDVIEIRPVLREQDKVSTEYTNKKHPLELLESEKIEEIDGVVSGEEKKTPGAQKNIKFSKILTKKYSKKIPGKILEKPPEVIIEEAREVMPGVIVEKIPEKIIDRENPQAEMAAQAKEKPDLSDDRLEQHKRKEAGALTTQNITSKAPGAPPLIDYSEPESLILSTEPGQVKLIEGSDGIIVIINEVSKLEPDEESKLIAGSLSGQVEDSVVSAHVDENNAVYLVGTEKARSAIDGTIEKTGVVESLLTKGGEVQRSEVVAEAEKLVPELKLKSAERVVLKNEGGVSKKFKTRTYIHIIVKGDTLWDIAKRYVNDPWRYPELASLSKIKNPDLIYPGNKVIVIIRSHNR